jgi:hypothetical protein
VLTGSVTLDVAVAVAVAELGRQLGDESGIVQGSRPSELAHSAWTLPGLEEVPDILAVLTFVVVARLFGPGTSLSLGIASASRSRSGQGNRVVNRVTVHPYGGR